MDSIECTEFGRHRLTSATQHGSINLDYLQRSILEAQRRTTANVEFLLDKTGLLDHLRGQLNPRQEKALLRMLREGPDHGGLSAGNYATITGASPATTTRDLADLVEKGALLRQGERRQARYRLAIPIREVSAVIIDKQGSFN